MTKIRVKFSCVDDSGASLSDQWLQLPMKAAPATQKEFDRKLLAAAKTLISGIPVFFQINGRDERTFVIPVDAYEEHAGVEETSKPPFVYNEAWHPSKIAKHERNLKPGDRVIDMDGELVYACPTKKELQAPLAYRDVRQIPRKTEPDDDTAPSPRRRGLLKGLLAVGAATAAGGGLLWVKSEAMDTHKYDLLKAVKENTLDRVDGGDLDYKANSIYTELKKMMDARELPVRTCIEQIEFILNEKRSGDHPVDDDVMGSVMAKAIAYQLQKATDGSTVKTPEKERARALVKTLMTKCQFDPGMIRLTHAHDDPQYGTIDSYYTIPELAANGLEVGHRTEFSSDRAFAKELEEIIKTWQRLEGPYDDSEIIPKQPARAPQQPATKHADRLRQRTSSNDTPPHQEQGDGRNPAPASKPYDDRPPMPSSVPGDGKFSTATKGLDWRPGAGKAIPGTMPPPERSR